MKITVVIVVYKIKLSSSKTIQSLNRVIDNNSVLMKDLSIIIYDNSPEKQDVPSQYEHLKIFYKHDSRNIGIVTAYNSAFQIAKDTGSEWLLLLDHDTELTEDYVRQIGNLGNFDNSVVTVVPKINYESIMISPVFSDSFRPLKGEKPQPGLQNSPVMAINSGALIRVSFLTEINGFNPQFPLDYLDHWLFYEIYARGYKVWVLETTIQHELSVMDYSGISIVRYRSILDSEITFYKKYKKDLLPSYRMQLAKRLLKQMLLVKNKKIAAYTLRRILSL